MRIVHLAAGAGAMYCGVCARDVALVRALRARGHDVQVLPLYTPLRHDHEPLDTGPVFYSGILCYLEQHLPIVGRTPGFLRRLMSSPSLLRAAGKLALSTKPGQLGPLTVSVLSGKEGRQAAELRQLIEYLKQGPPPDLVSLTASLLSGLAPELRKQLGAPVVCTLQGEDDFIEALPEPYRRQARERLRENARAVSLFLAPSEAYRLKMAGFLGVAPEKIRLAVAGLDAAAYPVQTARPRQPFVIGYLSVITPRKGLDLLVDAVLALRKQDRDVRLHIAGRVLDARYWRSLRRALAGRQLSGRWQHFGEVDWAGKLSFFQGLSAFALPSRFEESRGLAVMEAMACGVPVSVPASGVFTEMLARTGGGLSFPPGDAAGLTGALAALMDDPERADALGRAGAEAVRRHYSAEVMATQVEEAYRQALAGASRTCAHPATG
jgi:glycosyltransferase involved in cell wall biosynthesis